MYRFFIPIEQIFDNTAEIAGDDVNHIKNVLRMGTGGHIMITDGRGTDYHCIIRGIEPDRVLLDIEKKERSFPWRSCCFRHFPRRTRWN